MSWFARPYVPQLQPTTIMSGACPLLALPIELQLQILAYVPQPNQTSEYGRPHPDSRDVGPRRHLVWRLRHVRLIQPLRHSALPAYFQHTQLNLVIGSKARYRNMDPVYNPWAERQSGTFGEDLIFYRRTVKLRIELESYFPRAVGRADCILRQCSSLSSVVVCVHNLKREDAERLVEAVRALLAILAVRDKRTIRVREETKEEYDNEMKVRRVADQEYEYYEASRRAREDWRRWQSERPW